MNKNFYLDNKDSKIDWLEPIIGNMSLPSCEECGCMDIQYYATLKEKEENIPYLICNECNHIFEANLR